MPINNHPATGGRGNKKRVLTKGKGLSVQEIRILIAGRTDAEIAAVFKNLASAKGGGRPHPIDLNRLATLRMMGCSQDEIAAEFGINRATIADRLKTDPAFARLYEQGTLRGRVRLRSAQFKSACIDGNVTAMIWLGKQAADGNGLGLGQRDTQTLDPGENNKICITISKEDSML
jgi:hypothetical protein